MSRKLRKVVIRNIETGEVLEFDSALSAANFLGAKPAHLDQARYRFSTCMDWQVSDTVEGIEQRIQELREQQGIVKRWLRDSWVQKMQNSLKEE